MCYTCWESEGSPTLSTDLVRAMVPLIEAANPFGALHIIVDDWNLEDEHVAFCREQPEATGDEIALADLMASATLEERASAMAFANGFAELPALAEPLGQQHDERDDGHTERAKAQEDRRQGNGRRGDQQNADRD